MPAHHGGVRIATHEADFLAALWPFEALDGILIANALHYVHDQPAFLRRCRAALARPRLLLVEYDGARFTSSPVVLGRRPSRYGRADLYAMLWDDD